MTVCSGEASKLPGFARPYRLPAMINSIEEGDVSLGRVHDADQVAHERAVLHEYI